MNSSKGWPIRLKAVAAFCLIIAGNLFWIRVKLAASVPALSRSLTKVPICNQIQLQLKCFTTCMPTFDSNTSNCNDDCDGRSFNTAVTVNGVAEPSNTRFLPMAEVLPKYFLAALSV